LILQLGEQVRDDAGRRSKKQVICAVVDISLVHLNVCIEFISYRLCEMHECGGVARSAAEREMEAHYLTI
jgi:hypothetical protein